MTATIASTTPKTFRVRVTNRNTITLPAELREHLGIEAGDTIDLVLNNGWTFWYKPSNDADTPPAPEETIPPLEGLLSDYFTDREDVQQFLEEERRAWEEREERLWAGR